MAIVMAVGVALVALVPGLGRVVQLGRQIRQVGGYVCSLRKVRQVGRQNRWLGYHAGYVGLAWCEVK